MPNPPASRALTRAIVVLFFWMQTFLPYPCFASSAQVLDRARLGKQRVETKQILLALECPLYGWQHHPAVTMWRGFAPTLASYGVAICAEWLHRGYKDNLIEFFFARAPVVDPPIPSHFTPEFHASHRSNLLRKSPEWYSQFGWAESADLPYVWPNP